MKNLFRQTIRTTNGKLIIIALLTLFFTNISEAQFDTGQQAMSLLPVSFGSTDSGSQNSGANFIIDFIPGGFLYSPDMDGFSVSRSGGGYYETQYIDGYASWMPNLRAGLRINSPAASFDITAGGGYLLNGAISGPFTLADFAVNFNSGKKFSIGPHVGIISFGDLDWNDFDSDYFSDPDIEFSGSSGLMGGLAMTFGGATSRFYLGLDYIEAEFDVETVSSWVANRTKLDLTGFALQLGLFLRF
jgi:hypothetical protein